MKLAHTEEAVSHPQNHIQQKLNKKMTPVSRQLLHYPILCSVQVSVA